MKRLIPILVLLAAFFSGCVSSRTKTINAMKEDYLSGKMDRETYLKRINAIKNENNWRNYSKESDLRSSRSKERFYQEYQSRYTDKLQDQSQPETYCYQNLDGGITCQKHIY